jgi:hypothetical protein
VSHYSLAPSYSVTAKLTSGRKAACPSITPGRRIKMKLKDEGNQDKKKLY